MRNFDISAVSDELYKIQLLVNLKHTPVRFNKEHYIRAGDTNKIWGFYHQMSSICHLYANYGVYFIVNVSKGIIKKKNPSSNSSVMSTFSCSMYLLHLLPLSLFLSHSGIRYFKLLKLSLQTFEVD